ncbi:MAG: hypothetical protein ACRED5_00580 [Propylenella sp.]
MLRANLRYILYFDLAMVPYPSDAPPQPLADFISHLEKRVKAGLTFQVIDNERRVIRLSELRRVTAGNGSPAVALLFSLGDRDKAEPGFTNFVTGKIRIAKRERDEAGGLSVHAILSLDPTKPGGHLYRMLYEDVSGLGRSLIQNFLRAEFKTIAEEQELTFSREGKREIRTRPLVELAGHQSDKLKDSLKRGTLLYVELVNHTQEKPKFDEARYVSSTRRDMRLSISRDIPRAEQLPFLDKLNMWANTHGYESMRVRWRDENIEKPQSAKVDTVRQDAGEAFFVKAAEVRLRTSLPDISETMSNELVARMRDLLE